MSDLLFLKPVFQERIWGGRALETVFGYDIPNGNIGECWGISAHPNGESMITNGQYKGRYLSDVWENDKALFAHASEEAFPLLVKILDANDDLSVQVHPDDAYAAACEAGELGKTECWYIIDATADAEIIFGHHATTKAQAAEWIKQGKWSEFLRRQPVKIGDFFYVPAGTIHALCKGCLVLEVQQSSDTTYRLYDYDRTDADGNLRDLHIDKSLAVATIPHHPPTTNTASATPNDPMTPLISNEFFSVFDVSIQDYFTYSQTTYTLVSVINGSGYVNEIPIKKGAHFIIPATVVSSQFKGKLQLIMAQMATHENEATI